MGDHAVQPVILKETQVLMTREGGRDMREGKETWKDR